MVRLRLRSRGGRFLSAGAVQRVNRAPASLACWVCRASEALQGNNLYRCRWSGGGAQMRHCDRDSTPPDSPAWKAPASVEALVRTHFGHRFHTVLDLAAGSHRATAVKL